MKKLINIFPALVAAAILSSCGHTPDKLPVGNIVREVNKGLESKAAVTHFVPVRVGTYVCQDSLERHNLRALAAAGIVTYDVNRYVWWEKSKKNVKKAYKVRRGGYFYSYEDTEYKWVATDAYELCDNYVVSVCLTSKGKRLAVKELPAPRDTEDRDLREPEIDESKYAWNRVDISETWPDVKNPFVNAEDAAPAHKEKRSQASQESRQGKAAGKVVRLDSLQYKAFNALTLEDEQVYLKACELKAVKARNVRIDCSGGAPRAKAEVIVSIVNVTDAGRICLEVENDIRNKVDLAFKYYADKGWKLNTDGGLIEGIMNASL